MDNTKPDCTYSENDLLLKVQYGICEFFNHNLGVIPDYASAKLRTYFVDTEIPLGIKIIVFTDGVGFRMRVSRGRKSCTKTFSFYTIGAPWVSFAKILNDFLTRAYRLLGHNEQVAKIAEGIKSPTDGSFVAIFHGGPAHGEVWHNTKSIHFVDTEGRRVCYEATVELKKNVFQYDYICEYLHTKEGYVAVPVAEESPGGVASRDSEG